jgi:hypothetical protein
MLAIMIVGLVTALVVLWWRAAQEIRRAHAEMQMARAVAEDRAMRAEMLARNAEARAQSAERKVEELLRKSSDVDGDQETSEKPPARRPSVAP